MKRVLAAIALTAGVLGAMRGAGLSPPIETLAAQVAREEDHVTALELAQWLRDRRPALRVIDLGEPSGIPRAERVDLQALVRMPFRNDETIVLVSGGGGHAAQGWVFLRARGLRHVYFLRGGADEWNAAVLNPARPTELTRYFGRRGC